MTPFGTTRDGRAVEVLTLSRNALSVKVLTFGAVLQDVRFAGVSHSLTLGGPDLAAYEGPFASFGSIMGPVANRLRGASARIAGKDYHFEPNLPGGHILHSGNAGLQKHVWRVTDHGPEHATLETHATDGDGGFPGKRHWQAQYRLSGDATLTLTITAQTDAPTLMNTVNHSYWCLGPGPTYDGQVMQISADHYLPVDQDYLPTGEIAPVVGTRFDFNEPRALTSTDVLDNNYCLSRARGPLRPAASLTGTKGLRLSIATTEPGLQVYDGKSIAPQSFPGHEGQTYVPRAGIAFEPQFWPNAPNEPDFPEITLNPGQDWVQTTEFSFDQA